MKGILFKDYDNYVKGVSRRLKQASVAPVLQQNLPVEYLRGGDIDKDQRARQIATERGITTGDVCVLSATELAHTFEHHGTHMEIRGMHMEIRKRRLWRCITISSIPNSTGCSPVFRPGFPLPSTFT